MPVKGIPSWTVLFFKKDVRPVAGLTVAVTSGFEFVLYAYRYFDQLNALAY